MLTVSSMPRAIKFKTCKWLEIHCLQPATVLKVNAMNTSAELSELLRQGDIPRLHNQELRERMPVKKPFEVQPQSSSSSSIKIEKRSRPDIKPDVSDLNASSSNDSVPPEGTHRGEKRKEIQDDIPSPSLRWQ